MTIPEMRQFWMQTALLSTYASLLSMRWGEARWTAYFMKFAAGFGCAARIVERVVEEKHPEDAKFVLAQHLVL